MSQIGDWWKLCIEYNNDNSSEKLLIINIQQDEKHCTVIKSDAGQNQMW